MYLSNLSLRFIKIDFYAINFEENRFYETDHV